MDDVANSFFEFSQGQKWTADIEVGKDGEIRLSSVYFRMASKSKSYSLNPYGIMSLLGDMGGLLDIVWAVGIILTASEVSKGLERSLLKQTY